MELLPLACLCLLTWTGRAFGDETGPHVTKKTVNEDDEAILPCSLGSTSVVGEVFDWKKDGRKEVFFYRSGDHYNNGLSGQDAQFSGRVFHFKEQLALGNASILIRNAKVTDSGNYTCDFPFHQPKRRAHIQLIVDPILKNRLPENIRGAAPKPSVMTVDQTNDWARLQCDVEGAFPKPKVEWWDSAGNILPAEEAQVTPREGRFDVILQTTVTKTGHYRCVATQEEIKHQIYAKTYVHLNDDTPGKVTVGVVVGIVVGVVGIVAGIIVGIRLARRC